METFDSCSLEEIENLFLVGRFNEALELCIQQLRIFYGFDFHSRSFEKANLNAIELTQETQTKAKKLSLKSSVPLLTLLIQILYELKRSDEIMNLVLRFYGSLEEIPFDILFIWSVLLISKYVSVFCYY
jgi:hypothetical protein